MERRKVLVIDDNEEWRQLLLIALQASYEVQGACDGEEGLRQIGSFAPDVVLCDIMMPKMSGSEVLRALYQDPRSMNMQIVMMTAKNLDAATADLFKKHPIVRGYLRKPCSVTDVLGTVDYVLRNPRPRAAGAPGAAALPAAAKTSLVLIVDDDPAFFEYVSLLVPKADKITHAKDGQEGLEALRRFVPDLIILDLLMPNLSGFEFIRLVSKTPAYAHIPVILTTAAILPAKDKERIPKEFPCVKKLLEKTTDSKELQAAIEQVLKAPGR